VRCGAGRDTIKSVPQGQRLSGCERLSSAYEIAMTIRPTSRADGRLRFTWTCKQGGCVMGVGVRVRSSKLVRRRLTLGRGKPATFLVRPARRAHLGDVIEVSVVVKADNPGPAHASRWRVVL
jgi:hypothetical protein